MKKLWVFLLIFLFSCQKDDIFVGPELPNYNMVFESPISKINNGDEISFNISSTEKHQLIITNLNGSVITKESFIPTIGLNTKIIYTNILPKGEMMLILKKESVELNKTSIIIE